MAQAAIKPRRTQKQRSDHTQQLIIMAAARCIAREGFKAATMKSIALEAGITWGAIQHHFGTKEAILDAVLDAGGADMSLQLQSRHLRAKSLEHRVVQFLKIYEQALGSPLYQANLTIQRNEPHMFKDARRNRMQKAVDDLWSGLFGDLKINKKKMNEIRDFTFVTLNGIGMSVMLYDDGRKSAKTNLRLLRENLLHMLTN